MPSPPISTAGPTVPNIQGNKCPVVNGCNDITLAPVLSRRPLDITNGQSVQNTHITPTKSSISPNKLNPRTPSQYPVPELKYDFDKILGSGDLTAILDNSDDAILQKSDDCILIEPDIPLINLTDESADEGRNIAILKYSSPIEKKVKPFEIVQKPKLEPGTNGKYKQNKQVLIEFKFGLC